MMNQVTIKNILKQVSVIMMAFVLMMQGIHAQRTGNVQISGKVKKDGRPVSACDINVMQNGSVIQTIQSKENGSFIVTLDLQKNYTISFAKQGLVTKSILFDSRVPQDQSDIIYQNVFNIDLFDDMGGLSSNNAMRKPVAKISFNPAYEDFVHDNNYTKSIQAEQEKIRRDAEALLKQKDLARLDSMNKIWSDSLAVEKQRQSLLAAQKAEEDRILKEKEKARMDSIANANETEKQQANLELKAKALKDSLARADAEQARLLALAKAKAGEEAKAQEQSRKDSLARADAEQARLLALAKAKAGEEAKAQEQSRKDSLARADAEQARLLALAKAKAGEEANAKEQSRKDSLARTEVANKARQKFLADSTARAIAEAKSKDQERKDSIEKADLAMKANQKKMADSRAQAELEAKAMEQAKRDSMAKSNAAYQARQKQIADSTARALAGKAKEQELAKIQAVAERTRQKLISDSLAKAEQEKSKMALLLKANEDAEAKAIAEIERLKKLAAEKAKTDSIAAAYKLKKEKEEKERAARTQAEIQAKKDMLAKNYDKGDKSQTTATKPAAIPKIIDSDYKEGVTEETITETNRTIFRTVVKIDGATTNYQKIVYGWGGVFFFKNHMNMTETSYMQEIKHAKTSIKEE